MKLSEITAKLMSRVAGGGAIPGKIIVLDFGDDGLIRVDGAVSPPAVDNIADGAVDCRIKVSKSDFLDMAVGRQSPQAAYMTGKVRIEGDLGLAMQLGKIFG